MTKKGFLVGFPGARSVSVLNEHVCNSDLFPGCQVAYEIAKPQVSINSNNSSTDRKKTVTGNGNLQQEIGNTLPTSNPLAQQNSYQ